MLLDKTRLGFDCNIFILFSFRRPDFLSIIVNILRNALDGLLATGEVSTLKYVHSTWHINTNYNIML